VTAVGGGVTKEVYLEGRGGNLCTIERGRKSGGSPETLHSIKEVDGGTARGEKKKKSPIDGQEKKE